MFEKVYQDDILHGIRFLFSLDSTHIVSFISFTLCQSLICQNSLLLSFPKFLVSDFLLLICSMVSGRCTEFNQDYSCLDQIKIKLQILPVLVLIVIGDKINKNDLRSPRQSKYLQTNFSCIMSVLF